MQTERPGRHPGSELLTLALACVEDPPTAGIERAIMAAVTAQKRAGFMISEREEIVMWNAWAQAAKPIPMHRISPVMRRPVLARIVARACAQLDAGGAEASRGDLPSAK